MKFFLLRIDFNDLNKRTLLFRWLMKPTIETGAFLSDGIETERTWFKRKLRGVLTVLEC